MTPSTTRQCPLSPLGTRQPLRSFPLKSDVKPAGGASWARSDAAPRKTAANGSMRTFIDISVTFPSALSACVQHIQEIGCRAQALTESPAAVKPLAPSLVAV